MKFKLVILIFIFVRLLIALFGTWHPDVNNHVDWGIRFFEYGPKYIYAPDSNVWSFTWPNQPPGTMVIFAAVRKIYEASFSVMWSINTHIDVFPSTVMTFWESKGYIALLKTPFVFADVGLAYLIYKIVKKSNVKYAKIAAITFLANPVVIYNSSFWGQTDSLINLLALLAFYLLFRKKITLSMMLMALSLYIKISLIIFVPFYAIVLIKKSKISETAVSLCLSFGLIVLLTSFFSTGSPFVWLYRLYTDNILGQQLQVITANAANFWAIITGLHEQPHTFALLGLTYQYWAIIITAIFLLPVTVRLVKQKADEISVYWALAAVAFVTWMFLTNMHERYLYPFFPLATILLFTGKFRYSVKEYALISVISLLNMYNLWWKPDFPLLVASLSGADFLAIRMLAMVMLILFIQFYRRYVHYEAQ